MTTPTPPSEPGEMAHTGGLHPIANMPKDREFVARVKRAGCFGWLVLHWADGGGDEQPRFRGWFHWTSYGFTEIDPKDIAGWLDLPDLSAWNNSPRRGDAGRAALSRALKDQGGGDAGE